MAKAVACYAVLSTTLGATFVGFGRCGGYWWYASALSVHTVVAAAVLVVLILASQPSRLGTIVTVCVTLATLWYGGQIVGSIFYGQGADWGLDC